MWGAYRYMSNQKRKHVKYVQVVISFAILLDIINYFSEVHYFLIKLTLAEPPKV